MHRRFFVALSVCILSLVILQPVTSAPSANGVVFFAGVSIRFDHLTVDDGLSQNAILALLQDSQGYIWIGMQDGLNRYDGYTFTHFRHDPENPDSVSFNGISALYEDAEGYLWVGTWGGGLNRYNPDTGKFIHYLPDSGNPASLGNPVVTSIV